MKFTLESPTAITIRSVSDQEIRIGELSFYGSISISAAGVIDEWAGNSIESLSEDDFAGLFDGNPEIIVLGTGAKQLLPHRDLVFAMARRGVGFEVMDTRAAARTFNVLVAENRQIAAVLYL